MPLTSSDINPRVAVAQAKEETATERWAVTYVDKTGPGAGTYASVDDALAFAGEKLGEDATAVTIAPWAPE